MKYLLIPILALAGYAAPAAANGYLFFHEHQLDEEGKGGTVYFGAVRDTSGKPIRNAQVEINVIEYNQAITLTTDVLGRYKSVGVAREIRPDQVRVSVIKPGYVKVREQNLSRVRRAGAPIEINFIMSPKK